MKPLVPVKQTEFYAKVWRHRAMGRQPADIAAKLGVSEAKIIRALNYLVDRYSDILGRSGKDRILAEQAMAIETAMIALSKLAKTQLRADIRIQAIKAREELRKDWLNLLAQAGIVKVSRVSFFESVTEGMSVTQKKKLITLGLRRIRKIQERKEQEESQRVPEAERKAEVH